MATTSLWRIKGELGRVVRYAANADKTTNPAFPDGGAAVFEPEQWLENVIHYAVQDRKTVCVDETAEVLQRFVSGVNCMPETAREEMMATKAKFGKPGGVVAYHGYQSFAPGEATPEMAHEIGVKLAERLWGSRHEVVVATHLDKANHLHCHFVLNTVSFVDGKKYYRSERDYYQMQKESDALCRAYGLSVVEKTGQNKTRHYAEWQAEQDGRPTWRGIVKADVDKAIRQSMTEKQFFENLRHMGYEVKVGKDLSVRPPGKERFVRLRRNFGEAYAIEGIRKRILAQARPERRFLPADTPPKRVRYLGRLHQAKRMTGLRALYFYYLYRMGVLPKKRTSTPKQVLFLFREDIRFIRNIAVETRLLAKHHIDTTEQLIAYKADLVVQISGISESRKTLRREARGMRDEAEQATAKGRITVLSGRLKTLRREVKLCEEIEKRSMEIKDKLHRAQAEELSREPDGKQIQPRHAPGKEEINHEPFRGSR